MEFYEVIKKRKSLRAYDPQRPIPDDVLLRILHAGHLAPSAANCQPWRFIVIKSPEMLKQVSQCYARNWLSNAPLILVLIGKKNEAWIRQEDTHNSLDVDLAIAMDHLILAAANEGVGTCWIMAYNYAQLAATLTLEEDDYIGCITPLGYPPANYQPKPTPERKQFETIVEYR
jgi:nitroreductase